MPGVQVRQRFVDTGAARLDLWLDLTDSGAGLDGEILYRDDLFSAQQIDLLISHWAAAIRALAEFPDLPVGEIDIFGAAAGMSPAHAQVVGQLLESHPAVAEVQVQAPGPLVGGPAKIIFVRAAGASATGTELRDWLTERLEFALGPVMFAEADALPDPAALARDANERAEPAGDLEIAIAELWARALGVDRIYSTDNFFDLGGHSLLAVQVLKSLRGLGNGSPDARSLVTGTLRQLAVQMSASDANGNTLSA